MARINNDGAGRNTVRAGYIAAGIGILLALAAVAALIAAYFLRPHG